MATNDVNPAPETTSSSPSKAERDSTIEAVNHLIQGKRHLLVQDIPSAVTSLQEASRLLAQCYGELANECGEAYFYYGKALLEMAREDSSVLGNAIRGSENDDEDDEDDDEDEDDEEDNEKESNDSDDEDDEKANTATPEQPAKPDESTPGPPLDSQPGPSTSSAEDGTKKEDAEDEVTNLQLAWEMLELSKIIFSRQSEGNKDKQLKLAEIHLYLGEVSLESENYAQGIEEFNRCLAIQTEFLQPENRLLAETHYQLGLAHAFSDSFDEGTHHFKMAHGIIEEKIASLAVVAGGKEMEKEPDIMGEADPVKAAKDEIEELKLLLPEISEKIADTEDMKKNAIDAVKKAAMNSATLVVEENEKKSNDFNDMAMPSSSSESAAHKPVSIITHLIKRKRKNEDGDENDLKKVRCQTSSQVSSTSEASTSSSSTLLLNALNEAETSSITSSEEAKCDSRPLPDSEEAECLVSSAGKSSERRKTSESGDHCDSVHNGELHEANICTHSSLSSEVTIVDI